MQYKDVTDKVPWYHHITITNRSTPDADTAKELLGALALVAGGQAPASYSTAMKLNNKGSYQEFAEGLYGLGYILYESSESRKGPVPESEIFFSKSGFVYAGRTTLPGKSEHDSVYISVVAVDPEEYKAVWELAGTHFFHSKSTGGRVFMMVSTQEGPEFHDVGNGGMELCRDNYSPSVLESYDRIKTELVAENPRGRLTIIEGPAGSGKSTMIRGLLSELPTALFVVIPSQLVGGLGDPSMLTAIGKLQSDQGGTHMVVIIEDADECLASRDIGNMSTIATVLNLSDGILGAVLDIRILATTNAEEQHLDEAVKRPGRLNTILHIGALDTEQANSVYQRLMPGGPEVFRKPATLAEIYQKAYDGGWKGVAKTASKKVGFS